MTLPSMDHPVVVGLREDQPGLLDFAQGLAGALDASLRVVHACQVPYPYAYAPLTAELLPEKIVSAARKVLTDAEKHLDSEGTRTDIAYDLVAGFPPAVLGAESFGAKMVVVGTDDVGWLDRVTGEAVTNFLTLHSHSPLMVVPPSVDSFSTIDQVLICVDGRSAATGPMQLGFELADRASLEVRVLHVMDHKEAKDVESARLGLAEVLAGWSETYPDITVISELVEGHDPAHETLRVAADTALVVVGRPNAGPLRSWRAPVARALTGAGRRPVAVVPPDYSL